MANRKAKHLTTRQISEQIEDWQNRPLEWPYPIVPMMPYISPCGRSWWLT